LTAFKAELESAIADQHSFSERVRAEVERWANPILDYVRSMVARLDNILSNEGYKVLEDDYNPVPEWSVDYQYMLQTTVYLFGQFFCWSRLLEERLRYDLFRSQVDKDAFLQAVRAVGKPLGAFPLSGAEALPPTDRQVFNSQQRAMGETLIVDGAAEASCMRLAGFLDHWKEEVFRARFDPLALLLTGLQPGTRRWLRVEQVLEALKNLELACEALLGPREHRNAYPVVPQGNDEDETLRRGPSERCAQ
jgi:hypothetical protein